MLAVGVAWSEVDRVEYTRMRWHQVAFACRYGKAGLGTALLIDGEQLHDFCGALSELMEDEGRASRR